MQQELVKIVPPGGSAFEITKGAIASINPQNCVNCGKCREMCPVGAITEQQRIICRLCPSCTSKPALTHADMVSLATEKSCTTECPLGISPQGYVNLTRAGKEIEAYRHIWDKNPLPSICGRICHHPCEQACKRGILVDEPIAIRGIKRYLTDNIDYVPGPYPKIYEETIAVIGAGPAGLAAGHTLALAGYTVTLFDGESKAGGMLNRGIPAFRLPRDVTEREIGKLVDAGLTIQLGERIGKAQAEALVKDYDAVIVAAGAPNARELPIKGCRKEGIFTALQFMERVNAGQDIWRHPGQEFTRGGEVVVIGGGNVAIDSARTAVRLGAKKVTVLCLESGADVPCHEWERREAEDEGIELLEGWAPQQFTGLHNVLQGVEFFKVSKFSKESDGKISFETDAAQSRIIPADMVIVAIGQKADDLWKIFEGKEKLFYAGDVRSNAYSVIDAMASGKEAAARADRFLRGRAEKDPLELRQLNEAPLEQKIYPAVRLKIDRPPLPVAAAAERIHSFDEVETEYAPEVIETEVLRCLQCGYQRVDAEKCIGCGVCKAVCPKGDSITMVQVGKGGAA
ncbi:MAG: FAD-dependent oxidoreductase [Treponema sp.]|jgi:NADPH-dependent glutamate synthase beta subunit-like oxidoreductase|nr:FAD-dependent oxidoreductase [Treponema sp.]